ncbi:MAG: glutathione-dependent formaldehyde dehydrogenase [Planctomycetes bacterium]|nr:glutathione-dependent formaldehyde dehydrogenase [Planctomycetota bacterium]
MKALTYRGSHKVQVEEAPDPRIEQDDDVILRVTATAICGSDLHIYRGKIPAMKAGDILGHEFMGIVEQAGSAVSAVKVGDRVVVPFNIACGSCFFCERELFAACETTNIEDGPVDGRGALINKKDLRSGAAMFGFSHLYGGIPGGQAERVRVPKANVGPFKVPHALEDEQVLFLSDILPTGFMAVVNAEIGPGSRVAIFGAGPVGLMAAASARLKGADEIFMVDHHAERLAFAEEEYGVHPLDFDKVDAAKEIVARTNRRGVDAVIDAVGLEAKGSLVETALTGLKLEGSSGAALRQAIASVRRGGVISTPGVYAGFIHGFMYGDAFDKGVTFRMGQTHTRKFMPELLAHIEAGRLAPERIITHRLPLAEAQQGYDLFNEKTEGCRKVVLRSG